MVQNLKPCFLRAIRHAFNRRGWTETKARLCIRLSLHQVCSSSKVKHQRHRHHNLREGRERSESGWVGGERLVRRERSIPFVSEQARQILSQNKASYGLNQSKTMMLKFASNEYNFAP